MLPGMTKRQPTKPFRPGRPTPETGLTLLAGLMVTAGLPPLPYTGLLVPAGLGLLAVRLVRSHRPGRTAWQFGLAHQVSLLSWLFFLDPSKSIPTRALVPTQAILTMVYVAVFYLGVGWAFGRLRGRLGAGRALAFLPVLWMVMEALRSRGEMAFPWCLAGSAVLGTPFMRLLRLGEPAVGTWLVFLAAAAAAWWLARRAPDFTATMRLLAGGSLVLTVLLVGGAFLSVTPPLPVPIPGERAVPPLRTGPLTVAAVQANVALADKWNDARIDSTRIPYAELTRRAAVEGAQFVIWAETAIPAYVRFDKDLMAWMRELVREVGVPVYAGFPDAVRDPERGLMKFNSSGLFGRDGFLRDKYAKHHLLPIGEAMPFTSVLPFLAKVDVGQAEWSPGPPPQPMVLELGPAGFPFSGLICFESAFGSLARESVVRGSRCLVVITNDGWFGKTAGPRQHSALARLRAVECGVPVIRCANNGISFICDERGAVLDRLGLGHRGLVMAEILPGGADTPYVRWGSAPLAVALLIWALTVLVILPRRRTEGDR